jgi:hypothetical protein
MTNILMLVLDADKSYSSLTLNLLACSNCYLNTLSTLSAIRKIPSAQQSMSF